MNKIKYLTEKEKEFIRKNCKTKTITKISTILKRPYLTIKRLILKENLNTFKNIIINNIEFTPREFEILELISKGYSNVELSKKYFISLNTVKTHYNHILNKLNIIRENNENSAMRVKVVLWYYKNVKKLNLEGEE